MLSVADLPQERLRGVGAHWAARVAAWCVGIARVFELEVEADPVHLLEHLVHRLVDGDGTFATNADEWRVRHRREESRTARSSGLLPPNTRWPPGWGATRS